MAELGIGRLRRWLSNTPLRSLERAYTAALQIKELEDSHFDGDPIAPGSQHSDSVFRYFLIQLRRHLQTMRVGLAEFRASSLVSPDNIAALAQATSDISETSPTILEKLAFIDTLCTRYTPLPPRSLPKPKRGPRPALATVANPTQAIARTEGSQPPANPPTAPPSPTNETGLMPRSIFRTANRLRRELSPDYEKEVVDDFRDSRTRTLTSLRFLALLAILPLVAQITTKNLVFDPLVDFLRPGDPQEIELGGEFEEQAMIEFEHYKERLEFRHFLSGETEENIAQTEDKLRQKALELTQKYGFRSVEGVKNVLADLFSLLVFGWLIFIGREEIEILKSFLDQVVYGLSDSAKAFIIILFTDVFVGYHSPHGWEVLLGGLARHLGIPENQEAIFAFIATFPVFLDTLFKYWIFRYLNRVSPSAVATYKSMNE